MIRWIGALLIIIGLLNSLYAESNEEPLEGTNYSHVFWKRYTDALRGDATAQFQVGVMYERGIEIEKNPIKALQWYEKSAAQGHIDAQYNAGIMYASGRGTNQNDGMAIKWLGLAAKQGDKEARVLLLELIDSKLERKKPSPAAPVKVKQNEAVSDDGKNEAITPVTLVCKENATVCTGYGNSGECSSYKLKTALTSKEKRGNFYKISGIVTKKGWQSYGSEGWIAEENVDVRR